MPPRIDDESDAVAGWKRRARRATPACPTLASSCGRNSHARIWHPGPRIRRPFGEVWSRCRPAASATRVSGSLPGHRGGGPALDAGPAPPQPKLNGSGHARWLFGDGLRDDQQRPLNGQVGQHPPGCRVPAARQEWIAEDMAVIAATCDGLLENLGLGPGDIDRVFLTVGSSFVPSAVAHFSERFVEEKQGVGDELTSVARGLALRGLEGR